MHAAVVPSASTNVSEHGDTVSASRATALLETRDSVLHPESMSDDLPSIRTFPFTPGNSARQVEQQVGVL